MLCIAVGFVAAVVQSLGYHQLPQAIAELDSREQRNRLAPRHIGANLLAELPSL